MYEAGKIISLGGSYVPTASAEVIDLNSANPSWQIVNSMSIGRRQINSTILADGQVLVTGGVYGEGFSDRKTPVYSADLWNPDTQQWTTMSSMAVPRWYHSTALLMPDGRLFSAG